MEERERIYREALEKILYLRPAGDTKNKLIVEIEVIAMTALAKADYITSAQNKTAPAD